MILNLILLLMGTCISMISGVEHWDPAGTAIGSEQLHAPFSSAQVRRWTHDSVHQNGVSGGCGRRLIVSYTCSGYDLAHPSISSIRIEGINNDLRVFVPTFSIMPRIETYIQSIR